MIKKLYGVLQNENKNNCIADGFNAADSLGKC